MTMADNGVRRKGKRRGRLPGEFGARWKRRKYNGERIVSPQAWWINAAGKEETAEDTTRWQTLDDAKPYAAAQAALVHGGVAFDDAIP